MCCIFTCFGWLIDLFQRAWVFAMSFCMSGAICCVLMLGSLSGVALGYNYSLAEYMDLKETNVSVYLKRGVFDDEGMSDDMNFRRSGEEEEEGLDQIPNPQRRFGGGRQDGDSSTLSSGRRLDDSLLQSNQNHGYEGGLMKLTMAPPYPITTSTPVPLRDEKIDDIIMKHAPNSLNQLKEIQSLISYRKALAAREPGKPGEVLIGGYPAQLISGEQNYVPQHILNAQPSPGRRLWQAPSTSSDQFRTMQNYIPRNLHPALIAVPPPRINEQQYWEAFKSSRLFDEEYTAATSPQAIRLNTMDQHMFPTEPPTFPVFTEETKPLSTQRAPTQFMNLGLETGGDQFEQKQILDNYDTSRTKPGRVGGNEDTSPKSDNEYYDDDIKGLPVRRKRHIHGIKRTTISHNGPESEKEKSDGVNNDNFNTVNHSNVIANTDTSILVNKLVSESMLNTTASDLISKLARPESEKGKSDGVNTDKDNTVNHSNVIANTDPSILVNKLVSESTLNTKASDLISKLVRPESEKGKLDGKNTDNINIANQSNVLANTDPSILVNKLVSESMLNTTASDLISKLPRPESEKGKSDGVNTDKDNTVNHSNVIANTDPNILVNKLVSESMLNTTASDLISKLPRPESEKGKSDGVDTDKDNTVNHSNVIANTDPSILVNKLVSESTLNTKASDLISKLARPESEKGKLDGENTDNINIANQSNVLANTDPSILVNKHFSESNLNTKASNLVSKLENTPLYDQLINNKVYETESRMFMRGLLGKTSLGLNKINNKLNDASSADHGFFNQRRFVFSFV